MSNCCHSTLTDVSTGCDALLSWDFTCTDRQLKRKKNKNKNTIGMFSQKCSFKTNVFEMIVPEKCSLETEEKKNRLLRDGFGSVRFCPVSIVLNNDNLPEPDGTAGQPAVGF